MIALLSLGQCETVKFVTRHAKLNATVSRAFQTITALLVAPLELLNSQPITNLIHPISRLVSLAANFTVSHRPRNNFLKC